MSPPGLPAAALAALGYWRGLGAPPAHVARRTGLPLEICTAALAGLPLAPLPPIAGYPSRLPWPQRTAAALIAESLTARDPAADMIILAREGSLPAGEVRALVARIAAGLAAAGAGPERGVAIDATPRLESVLVAMATLLLGAPLLRLAGIVDAAGFAAWLTAAPVAAVISVDAAWAGAEPALRLGLDGADAPDFADWLDACPAVEALPSATVDPGDTALIGFTSGSTGAPKLVRTSHEAVFRATEAMQMLFGFGEDDIFCTATDFSALSAFRSLITLPLITGGRVALPSEAARQAPLALAADCAETGVTRLTAVPAVLRGLIAARGRLAPLPALRSVFSGSGILDQATRDRFAAAFGVPVIDYYGGREFATALYADPDGRETISSAGGLPCNCLLAIVDDDGAPVAEGAVGMIMVHSDCLMQDDPAGSHPDWRGWHETGDLGRRDAAGRLQVVGRRREVIKARDGSLVFPIDIEAQLMAMPDVAEAAVIGVADATGVEHIIAAIVAAAPLAADFEHRARAHVLAAAGQSRVPARVIPVAELPRVGAAAKLDRAALRARLAPLVADLT